MFFVKNYQNLRSTTKFVVVGLILLIVFFFIPYFSIAPTESGEFPSLLIEGLFLIPFGIIFGPLSFFVGEGDFIKLVFTSLFFFLGGLIWIIGLVLVIKRILVTDFAQEKVKRLWIFNTFIWFFVFAEFLHLIWLIVIGEF